MEGVLSAVPNGLKPPIEISRSIDRGRENAHMEKVGAIGGTVFIDPKSRRLNYLQVGRTIEGVNSFQVMAQGINTMSIILANLELFKPLTMSEDFHLSQT